MININHTLTRVLYARVGHFCGLLCVPLAIGLGGCVAPQGPDPVLTRMDGLQVDLARLEAQLAETQAAAQTQEAETALNVATLNSRILQVQERLDQLPQEVSALMPQPDAAASQCETATPSPSAVIARDKLVVGEVERIWLDPPKAQVVARVDTGADSSSLHAENRVEFERDGEDWVRFDIKLDDEMVTVEREILRYVRVYQQADPEGTRRPVVTLRVRLGDLNQKVEFTLADRSHLDFEVILGRNFLTDVALVDVGKQYIQPPFNPANKKK